jgi:hypothetical protein
LTEQQPRVIVAAAFLTMAALYVIPLFVTDPSLRWAAQDEVCCHVPTIRAIRDEGLAKAITDYRHYRSATAPFYHLLMALVLDRVEPMLLRAGWIVITLLVGVLLYNHVRIDPALDRGSRAALALAITFLLSPTVRASAVYFITDGLAVHLAIVALVLLRRARSTSQSIATGLLANVAAFASFYTRQYYLWVALYVACCSVSGATTRRAQIATICVCAALMIPALCLFVAWHGFTPPLDWPIHTTPVLLSTAPNALGLLAIYGLPLAWFAVYDTARAMRRGTTAVAPAIPLLAIGGMFLYVLTLMVLGFEIPPEGGILRVLRIFGIPGTVLFLAVSYVGLMLLLRWLIVDGLPQLLWMAFLLPLLAGSILLQRYFEPAILVILFLAARPRDALRVLDSDLVWFYPSFAAVYALGRMIYVTANL